MPLQQLLNRANRQGTAISAEYNAPANLTGTIRLRGDIAAADLADVRNSLSLSIEVFRDPVWEVIAGLTWVGGGVTMPGRDPQPFVGFDSAEIAGKRVRISLSIPRTMRIGAVVEVS